MLKSRVVPIIARGCSSHVNANNHQYKLTYFDIKGLGESIRWQFVLAGVEFEDYRIKRDTWPKFKSTTGWGQLPILQINGKIEIIQSSAIGRYLGHEFNTVPDNKSLHVRCDELVAVLQDVFIEWRNNWIRQSAPWVPNKDPRRIHDGQTYVIENVFPHYFGKIDGFIKLHGSNGFAVGDKISWADLVLANLVDVWVSKHGTGIMEKFPRVVEQRLTVVNQPRIKEWIANRPRSFV